MRKRKKKVNKIIANYAKEIWKKWVKKIDEEIFMLDVMKEYWWTYQEYNEQPKRVIDLIAEKQNLESKFFNLKAKNGK